MRFKDKYPLLLSAMAILGTVGVGIATAKSTVKAVHILDIAKDESDKELTKKEKFELLAPTYIPPVLICLGTISCIAGAHILNRKQQASILSAYIALDRTYKNYCDKVKGIYGDDIDTDIKKEIVKEQIIEDDMSSDLDDDECLFYEEYSNSYFEASMRNVKNAEKKFNEKIRKYGHADTDFFYSLVGGKNQYRIDCSCKRFDREVIFDHELIFINDDLGCYIIRML